MSFTDKKLEISILVFTVALISGMSYLLKEPVKSALGIADVGYEMPRPKQSFLASLFDLGDREISRQYVNPFAKKKEEAKKIEAAKKAAAVVAKAAEVKKVDAKKTAAVVKAPQVDVTIVDAAPEKKWADDDGAAARGPVAQTAPAGGGTDAKAPNKNENTLSGDQWRALLMAQPTAENVAKLNDAYAKGDVNDQTFYMILADLYRANKAETQALGLQTAKSVHSARSFALTAQYFDQFPAELQAQAHTYLLSYAASSRLTILATLLRSTDAEVVSAAAEVVIAGYQQAQNGVVGGATDPRASRGNVTANSVTGYSQFIPIFQQLATNQDPAIATLANTALSQIQNTVASL